MAALTRLIPWSSCISSASPRVHQRRGKTQSSYNIRHHEWCMVVYVTIFLGWLQFRWYPTEKRRLSLVSREGWTFYSVELCSWVNFVLARDSVVIVPCSDQEWKPVRSSYRPVSQCVLTSAGVAAAMHTFCSALRRSWRAMRQSSYWTNVSSQPYWSDICTIWSAEWTLWSFWLDA